jgi:hypothetical protein
MDITELWYRTCQECGNKQTDKQPEYGKEPSNAYTFRKCKKCKSESLDYGSVRFFDGEGIQVEQDEDSGEWTRIS